MDDEIKILRIILKVVWQGALSFFIGAGFFYLAAPHSTEHGVIFEAILLFSLVGLAFLIVTALKFILKNKITFVCFVAFSAAVIVTHKYYPIEDRKVEPSAIVEREIRDLLENQFPYTREIKINTRGKRSFDLLRPKIWTVIFYTNDDPSHKRVYVKQSLFGDFVIEN